MPHFSADQIHLFLFFSSFFGYTIATSFQCTITTLIEILATLSLLDNRFLRMIDYTAFSSIGPLHEHDEQLGTVAEIQRIQQQRVTGTVM